MFTSLRIVNSVLFGLILLAGTAWAASSSIQGDIKGPDGKPIRDAQVTIALKDAKGSLKSAKTDGQGRYVFNDLARGEYTVSVKADGMAATTATDVKPRADGALRLDFNLKKQTGVASGVAKSKKKATHMVWVPAQTGSNLGGRWVEVDDQGTGVVGNERVDAVGRGAVKGMQSNSGAVRGSGN
jgi:hypothetical protein